ncbi:CENP-B homolog protein 2-like protein [Tanacetum coccineum]|uniref:CENP-B homolog protein 2-like protein n=1 Tax=Tanacetum coccineum TaxID=301880 RepID=A0ABQ5DTU0_9ASTR
MARIPLHSITPSFFFYLHPWQQNSDQEVPKKPQDYKSREVSQPTISNTVKRSLEYLSLAPERGDVKRHKPAKFPDLEKSLYEWILQYQEHVNMTGELIIEKAKKFMKDMYPVDTPDFTFSIGWLGKFKARYGIKNFRRFGESGSVEMEGMEDKLKSIRDKVDQFEMKDHI